VGPRRHHHPRRLRLRALVRRPPADGHRHPRPPALTYLFPAVIDGFIAYGVRALLVLRTAPFRARLYVWTLFATATAASIWANALHAVRLNQQAPTAGLHLGDTTVGALSTIAPLALAGAVHLHILITRHDAPAAHAPAPHPREAPQLAEPTPEDNEAITHDPTPEANPSPDESVRRIGRPPSAELDELLTLVRPVFAAHENPTRNAVRDHIRAAGHAIAEDRLTQIMTTLRRDQSGH
jgi:hypothetical protein